jgi:FkbM family methyltransferase
MRKMLGAALRKTGLAKVAEEYLTQVLGPAGGIGRKVTYSHWGEDVVVSYFLSNKRDGFYVDVGCFHPTLASNTKLLFDAGWSGVNIDPNKFMIEEFRRARPNDINLNLALAETAGGEIDFFIFDTWASSNTASAEFAQHISKNQNVPIERKLRVPCETLGNIFERYCRGRQVDFLNVDVESLDLKVLQASDWERWRPSIVAIEDFEFDYANPTASGIFNFLISKRYRMVSRNVYTSFFVSDESGIRL